MSDEAERPKIIVDTDWKEQVRAEKAALEQGEEQNDAEPTEPDAVGELPPASFSLLVSALATQAVAAMGQLRDPNSTEAPPVDRNIAKHQIDLLSMLEEKTKGNLSAEEAMMLQNVLHELRMLFVNLGI